MADEVDKTKARAELKNFARMVRNLVALDSELEQFGSFDEIARRHRVRLEDLERQVKGAEDSLAHVQSLRDAQVAAAEAAARDAAAQILRDIETLKSAVELDRSAAASDLAGAQTDADGLRTKARADADLMAKQANVVLSDAQAKADAIRTAAQSDADQAQQAAGSAKAELANVAVQIAEQTKTLADLKAEIAVLSEKLAV